MRKLVHLIIVLYLNLIDTVVGRNRDKITIRTSSGIIPGITGENLLNFIAIPSNWPKIVLSSNSVEGDSINKPLMKGKAVIEIFGAPPILPLKINWICESYKYPYLNVVSEDGVPGIAKECRMKFLITENTQQGASVELEMSYMPTSLLAVLAKPILNIDNNIAIKFLLPYMSKSSSITAATSTTVVTKPIDKFRQLMGTLYGGAGLAHAFDVYLGNSDLFTSVGLPPFHDLSEAGKIATAIWCLAGPLSFCLSRWKDKEDNLVFADFGLIAYGCTEVGCAVAAQSFYPVYLLVNALGVQLIVALSWLYSSSRNTVQ